MEKNGPHHEGNLLRILNENKVLNVKKVLVAWIKCENYSKKEEHLIKKYVKKYGEVPPLNARIEKREDDWPGDNDE